MKKIYMIIGLILTVSLLTGCFQFMPAPTTNTTVPLDAPPENADVIRVTSLVAYGVDTEGKIDKNGLYYPYYGGEMSLNLYIQASGAQEAGITILLFMNGQPQPYSMEGSEANYMHTVYPQHLNDNIFNICFIPIAGSVGEMAELCIMYLPSYHYHNSSGAYPWYDENNVRFYMTRIKLEKAPAQMVLPELQARALSFEFYNSEEKNYGRRIGVNVQWNLFHDVIDEEGNVLTGIGNSDSMRIYLKLSGDPKEEYVLILYVDGEPVLINDKAITFCVVEDQTLIAEIELDCTGFEYMMFAVILEKDYFKDSDGWETCPSANNFDVFCMKTS